MFLQKFGIIHKLLFLSTTRYLINQKKRAKGARNKIKMNLSFFVLCYTRNYCFIIIALLLMLNFKHLLSYKNIFFTEKTKSMGHWHN